MNYYPNFPSYYPNYYPQQQQQQQPSSVITGKFVDSEDIVKVTEIPIGGCGVFPRADFSEVYIKLWNNNGTTRVLTFKISDNPQQNKEEVKDDNNFTQLLLTRIGNIEEKIDSLLPKETEIKTETKGVKLDAF